MKRFLKKISYISFAFVLIFNIFSANINTFITEASEIENVIVGGMPFGVKFYSQGIQIVGFTEIETEKGMTTPAYDAGLRINDKITHVNGLPVKTSVELIEKIEKSTETIEITYIRNGTQNIVSFSPSISLEDGKKKTGMWIRDTTAGIGTVTFILPETGTFAGLGHGICDPESGELLKMDRGVVVDVQISGVSKGVSGTPGELKGYFTSDKSGVLIGNTQCGVYGVFSDVHDVLIQGIKTEIGNRDYVKTGAAYILSTVENSSPQKYEIQIKEINRNSNDNRSFLIEVTDKNLLDKTGGIVQGMSGSPIIQNGKLIGAVTHVLVNNPKEGYGIFIENMLDAMPELLK